MGVALENAFAQCVNEKTPMVGLKVELAECLTKRHYPPKVAIGSFAS